MIDYFAETYGLEKPRTYRRVAPQAYLAFAKAQKPSADKVRSTVKEQLSYARRDLGYICHALLTKEEAQEYETRDLIERMFDGSRAKFLPAFLAGKGIDDEEAEELKILLKNGSDKR